MRPTLLLLMICAIGCQTATAGDAPVIRTAGSGAWSAPQTWEGNRVPTGGARVLVRAGHRVVYDVESDQTVRSIHIAGTLSFARDKTRGSMSG